MPVRGPVFLAWQRVAGHNRNFSPNILKVLKQVGSFFNFITVVSGHRIEMFCGHEVKPSAIHTAFISRVNELDGPVILPEARIRE